MKVIRTTMLWAIIAILAVCLTACSKEEPFIPTEQEQEENPTTDHGNTEDSGNQDDPEISEDTEGNPEFWEDEPEHGFYFDVNNIQLHLNQDGFLLFRGQNPSDYKDEIVMESKWNYPSTEKSNAKNIPGAFRYPYNFSPMKVTGRRATPWNNVNRYKEMFRKVHVRPDSKFSDFPELANLPLGNVQSFGFFVWDTLVYAEVVTHKYFNSNLPAGSLMPGTNDGSNHPTGVFLAVTPGTEIFPQMQSGPWKPCGTGPDWALGVGNITEHNKLPASGFNLFIIGYPEKAGDYPMTLTLKFSSGRVLTKDFKVRYVNEN